MSEDYTDHKTQQEVAERWSREIADEIDQEIVNEYIEKMKFNAIDPALMKRCNDDTYRGGKGPLFEDTNFWGIMAIGAVVVVAAAITGTWKLILFLS